MILHHKTPPCHNCVQNCGNPTSHSDTAGRRSISTSPHWCLQNNRPAQPPRRCFSSICRLTQGHSVANRVSRCSSNQSFPPLRVFPFFPLSRNRRSMRDCACTPSPPMFTFYFVLVNRVCRMTPKVISNGNAADALAASMAVPLLFKPVWADGRALLDGAVGDVAGVAGLDRSERTLYHHVRSSGIAANAARIMRHGKTTFSVGLYTAHTYGIGALIRSRDSSCRVLPEIRISMRAFWKLDNLEFVYENLMASRFFLIRQKYEPGFLVDRLALSFHETAATHTTCSDQYRLYEVNYSRGKAGTTWVGKFTCRNVLLL